MIYIIIAATVLFTSEALSGKAWHFTDVHLDPLYKVNSSIENYCNGVTISNKSLQAPPFGYAGGDCATPRLLYNSAISYMRESHPETEQNHKPHAEQLHKTNLLNFFRYGRHPGSIWIAQYSTP